MFGRKPVIYTGDYHVLIVIVIVIVLIQMVHKGLVTQAYFGILFGLAPSFGWATTLRLLAGALNGAEFLFFFVFVVILIIIVVVIGECDSYWCIRYYWHGKGRCR